MRGFWVVWVELEYQVVFRAVVGWTLSGKVALVVAWGPWLLPRQGTEGCVCLGGQLGDGVRDWRG